MPHELIIPSTIMSLAFVFYTTGVFAERFQRDLLTWHLALFWLGLACDGTATEMMRQLRLAGENPGIIHTVTGVAAFSLMALHALWATWVRTRGHAEARREFHKYSVVVWVIWLLPYLGGMIAGISRGIHG
jgi:uncharacterized repeat protein (TIGR03987 family)